jgi:hypothetical protein
MFTESWERNQSIEGEFVIDDSYGFVVDLAVAKALRDDVRALEDLPKTWRRNGQGRLKDQHDVLSARIAERKNSLQCPPGYGPDDAAKDEERLDELPTKRKSGVKSTRKEEAEEAHLMARVAEQRDLEPVWRDHYDHLSLTWSGPLYESDKAINRILTRDRAERGLPSSVSGSSRFRKA